MTLAGAEPPQNLPIVAAVVQTIGIVGMDVVRGLFFIIGCGIIPSLTLVKMKHANTSSKTLKYVNN